MDTLEAIFTRRSIRKFKKNPIPIEIVKKLLKAGKMAPSASNIQPWKFIVINKIKIIEAIKKVSPGFFGSPPLAIVVCSDRERAYRLGGIDSRDYTCIVDCAMAVENILLAAHSLGLGACPIRSFQPLAIKEILEIPNNIVPEIIIAIGYPLEKPKIPPKLSLKDIVFINKYGIKWRERKK